MVRCLIEILIVMSVAARSDARAITTPDRPGEPAATTRTAPDQHARMRRACLASLDEIRLEFDRFREAHPNLVGHLGPGAINASELSLHFPVIEPAKRIRPSRGRRMADRSRPRPGLFVQFAPTTAYPAGPDELAEAPRHFFGRRTYWFHTGARLGWTWYWVGGFAPEALKAFQRIVRKAARPVAELEAAAWARDVPTRGPGSYLLHGGPSLKLTIQLDPQRANDPARVLELFAENTTPRMIAIHPRGESLVIVDGKAGIEDFLPKHPVLFLSGRRNFDDPFVYLEPGESLKLGTASVGRLKSGRHTLRIAWQQTRAGWTDFGPIRIDGAPVYRKIDSAWTGVVVSDELTILVR